MLTPTEAVLSLLPIIPKQNPQLFRLEGFV